ncbi:MAG: TonB-dependent receptor plug domain-containing protein [Gemmatimonadales bacterium]
MLPLPDRLLALAGALLLLTLPLQAQQPAPASPDSATPAVQLQPLTVTADRRASRASDAVGIVRVVSRAELERRAAPDLTVALRDVPGVQIDPVVGSGAGVTLQGLGSDRVLILLDGAPLVGRLSGQLDLTRISPSLIERVEIVEGPQSTLYGSAALGGVVNLLTRRGGPKAEVSTHLGSRGQLDYRARLAVPVLGVNGSLDVGRRTVDLVPGRSAATVGVAGRWDGMLRTTSSLGAGVLDVRVLGIAEQQEYGTSSRGIASANFNDNWQVDALASATLDAAGRTEVRVHGSTYDHRFVRSATAERDGGTPEWDRQRAADVEGLYRGDLGRHRWLAGAKVEHEWLESDRVTGGSRAAWTGAAYGSADWAVADWLRASTGVRVTTGEVWGTDLAPRVALTARGPGGAYLKTAFARGFRAPSFKELYTDFTNTGTPSYTVRGNPDLEPEHSWNVTAEAGVARGGLQAYARAYRNWLRNFIETSLVDPQASLFLYQNVDRALTSGAEVGASATAGMVTTFASYTYVATEDESTGEELLGRARHQARGTVTVAPGPLSFTTELVHTSSVPLARSAAGTTVQGGYTRLNLSAGVVLRDNVHVTLGVDNVADNQPTNAATFLGRRWFGGLRWGLTW